MFFKSLRAFFLLLFAATPVFAEYQKVVVVGAGLAGLTTAYRLQQLTGETVEVYEARARVGGRVYTTYFYNSYVELGGKFIRNGREAVNLMALIKEMGLETENYTTEISSRKYYYQGKTAPYYFPFFNCPNPDEAAYNLLKGWAANDRNLGAALDRFLEGQAAARRLVEIRMRGYEGSDTKDLSVHYIDSFWPFYKKNYAISHGGMQYTADHETVKGGNSRLPEKLAEKLRGHLHLNQPLKKLSKAHDGKFMLEFPNSKIVTADMLVLAIPCSTLREIKVQDGIFPPDQWQAIKTLQYGTNGYVLMGVTMGNEDASEYSVTEDTVTWFNNDRKVLTLAFGGEFGIFEAHSSEAVNKIIQRELPALKMLYPSLKYPGKKQAVSWINEEYSKGSYSNWGVGQYEIFSETLQCLGETVRKVFRPIDNRLFLAGEHAAVDCPATMEGAVASGEATARMLALLLKPAPEKATSGPGS